MGTVETNNFPDSVEVWEKYLHLGSLQLGNIVLNFVIQLSTSWVASKHGGIYTWLLLLGQKDVTDHFSTKLVRHKSLSLGGFGNQVV